MIPEKNKWKAVLVKPSKYLDVDPRKEVPIWLSLTQSHLPSCLYGQLQKKMHQEALAAKEELIQAAKAGKMDQLERRLKTMKREFNCKCSQEITHLGTVVPCCDVFIEIPLSTAPDGTPLDFIHLSIPNKDKVHLYGTAILCVSCFSLYTLHEGWLEWKANAKQLGLTQALEDQWLGSIEADKVKDYLA